MDLTEPLFTIKENIITLNKIIATVFYSKIFALSGYDVLSWHLLLAGAILLTSYDRLMGAQSVQGFILNLFKAPFIFVEKIVLPLSLVGVFLVTLFGVFWVVNYLAGTVGVVVLAVIALALFKFLFL